MSVELATTFLYDVLEGLRSEDKFVYDAGFIISTEDFRYDVANPLGVQAADLFAYDVGSGVRSQEVLVYDVGPVTVTWTNPIKRRSRVIP